MFCTKCGRQLHDGDRFCAHCGARVRQEQTPETPSRQPKYEEVVFNPPFRAEAERRTQQISDEVRQYSSEPKRETVHFDWNLDGFPVERRRKDEEFELNWDSVIERRRDPAPVAVEKIVPGGSEETGEETAVTAGDNGTGAGEQPAKEEAVIAAEQTKEDVLSIEELEKELFGTEDMEEVEKSATIRYSKEDLSSGKDRFYTYNAKRDAFQDLLDKERARVEALENERKSQWDELTHTQIPEEKLKEPPKFEDVIRQTETPLVPPLREVGTAQPPRPAVVDLTEPEKTEPEKTEPEAAEKISVKSAKPPVKVAGETAEEEADEKPPFQDEPTEEAKQPEGTAEAPEKKTKLRFSDVFPADTFDSDNDSGNDNGGAAETAPETAGKKIETAISDDSDDDDEGHGRNKAIKAVIIILAIIVAIEIVIIGAKAIAPESGFSIAVDNIMSKITAVFTGDDGEADQPAETEGSYMEEYIRSASETGENIGAVTYAADLKYDPQKTYSFGEVSQTEAFTNSPLSGEDAGNKTYGQSIVEAVINYYDEWRDGNQDEDLVGVNSLEIGEIRSDDGGYRVLCKATYAAADGDTVSKYETAYITDNGGQLTVDEVKEETI